MSNNKAEELGIEGSTARTKAPASDPMALACERCGFPLENALRVAGPYCVNLECSRYMAVILPPIDLALRNPCPHTLNGSHDEHDGARCQLIGGHEGKHRAHSLGRTVKWSDGPPLPIPLPHSLRHPLPLPIGMSVFRGFCDGYFGRDGYGVKRVEAVGHDWILVRYVEDGRIGTASFSSSEEMAGCVARWLKEEEESDVRL